MKKFLIASVLSLFAVSAHADTAFDGLYGGVTGSYGKSKAEHMKDNAFTGGVYGGYGLTFDKFYLGGEAKGDFGGFKLKDGTLTAEKKFGFGASARAGYLINDKTLGYGIAGWERARIDVSEAGVKAKEDVNGFTFGAGVERIVKGNISVRSEVTHTKWKADEVNIKETKGTIGVGLRF